MTDLTQRPVLDLLDEQPKTQPSKTDKKGTTMTTAKKSTKKATTTTKKETTMTKTETAATTDTALSGQDKIAQMRREYDETIAALRKKHDPVDMQPVNAITGRPLNKDANIVDDLRYFAAEYGWDDPRFATGGQIKANGGKLPKDANSVTMFFPMGDKWRFYKVYNLADVEWPDGNIPTTFAVKSGKRAKATTDKGKKSGRSATKTATTSAVPAQLIRMTLPDGTVVEGRTVDEVIALKKALTC